MVPSPWPEERGVPPGELRQCLNRHEERLREVPRPEPEVRVTPLREMRQRPNGAVKRRIS